MRDLYKSNMRRLGKSLFFTGGCGLALLLTILFTSNVIGLKGTLGNMSCEGRMFFIGIAMMGFFTIFVPLFTNTEYRDGVIKNKILAGHSLKHVFFSHLLTHFSALFLMTLFYLAGGLMGGASLKGHLLVKNLILFAALGGYIAVLTMLALRFRNTKILCILAFIYLDVCYALTMAGNALISMILTGTAQKLGILLYNTTAFGQWMIHGGFTQDFFNPGNGVQLLISAVVILISVFLAIFRLDRKDLP